MPQHGHSRCLFDHGAFSLANAATSFSICRGRVVLFKSSIVLACSADVEFVGQGFLMQMNFNFNLIHEMSMNVEGQKEARRQQMQAQNKILPTNSKLSLAKTSVRIGA
mmetsp:Transcript_44663/g.140921  ORF Transcript_44663/g.140921 Transcript_44663/m.140921 type:complete len:108 (-) Transcript_44663:146-469(-)